MKKFLSLVVMGFLLFPLGAQTSSDLLTQGQASFDSQDYTSALVSFHKILSDSNLKSLQPGAYFWLGKTYFTLNDMVNAQKYLGIFLTNYPGHSLEAEGLYTKGRLLLVQGEYENSITIFNQFLSKYGENSFTANTIFWIAENTFQLGKFSEAKALYERLVKAYPTSPKVEPSQYRISLIEMKFREEELLNLLKWSHQESINAFDEFQRRERAFQKTLQEYETRLQELQSKDSQVARIAALEAQIKAGQGGNSLIPNAGNQVTDMDKLLELKNQALQLKSFYIDWERTHGK